MRVEKDLMATTVDVENPRKIGKVSVFLMPTVDLTKDIPGGAVGMSEKN